LCKEPNTKEKLKSEFTKHNIEYRPIIAGNLLMHPAYSEYYEFKRNANFLHYRGVYIGNNQFLTDKNFGLLKHILESI
jgi:CDP-6-deoxy-D-xylo-4-hexulose-3-dehydrase